MSAVILVPGQGLDAAAFGGTAKAIVENFYSKHGGALGFQTNIQRVSSGRFRVAFNRCSWDRGPDKSGFWPAVAKAKTFIVMGHYGVNDGPILNHVDTTNQSLPAIDRWWQPWGMEGNTLNLEGRLFWQHAGRDGRTNTAKIVLMGCESANVYGPLVARVAKADVYGFLHSCAAANHNTMIPLLKHIESKQSAPSGMAKL